MSDAGLVRDDGFVVGDDGEGEVGLVAPVGEGGGEEAGGGLWGLRVAPVHQGDGPLPELLRIPLEPSSSSSWAMGKGMGWVTWKPAARSCSAMSAAASAAMAVKSLEAKRALGRASSPRSQKNSASSMRFVRTAHTRRSLYGLNDQTRHSRPQCFKGTRETFGRRWACPHPFGQCAEGPTSPPTDSASCGLGRKWA